MNIRHSKPRSEIGSMFHWHSDFSGQVWHWPEPANYYLLCRHAISALCASQSGRSLWLPSFYCPEVARFCRSTITVREYKDDCRWAEPDWSSLNPKPDDLVLAVNYFGVRSPVPWRKWKAGHNCAVIEDHTQDPFSSWARSSQAEFAVCSIRKTLPSPDGAILWSPIGLRLPALTARNDWEGSSMKAAAMLYKRWYLAGASVELKPAFRKLQLGGEVRLGRSECSRISPLAEAIAKRGMPRRWRQQRSRNARALLHCLEGWNVAEPVFKTWPSGHAPFSFPFVYRSPQLRDFYQTQLRLVDVYCPVEWDCESLYQGANLLSSQILSIPVDHRYQETDMRLIANILKKIDASSMPGDGRLYGSATMGGDRQRESAGPRV